VRLPPEQEPLVPERLRLTRSEILTTSEVAELLRLPRSTVRDMARRGTLPGRKLGRRTIFLRSELERALRRLPSAKSAPVIDAEKWSP
jgi:excisionase family DNA binding protein